MSLPVALWTSWANIARKGNGEKMIFRNGAFLPLHIAARTKQTTKPEEAFNIAELGEMVLGHLSARDVLRLTRVCKQFKKVIDGSQKLQLKLFKIATSEVKDAVALAEFNELILADHVKTGLWSASFQVDYLPNIHEFTFAKAYGETFIVFKFHNDSDEIDNSPTKEESFRSMHFVTECTTTKISLRSADSSEHYARVYQPGPENYGVMNTFASLKITNASFGDTLRIAEALRQAAYWRFRRAAAEFQGCEVEDPRALLSWKEFFAPELMQYLVLLPTFDEPHYVPSELEGYDDLTPFKAGQAIRIPGHPGRHGYSKKSRGPWSR